MEKKFREDESRLENQEQQEEVKEKDEDQRDPDTSTKDDEEENEEMLDHISPQIQKLENSKVEDLEEQGNEEEKEIMAKNSLGGKGSMVNMILKASPGAQESLANLQVSCESGVAGVKALYRLFDWSDSAKTKGVTYVVFNARMQ